MKRFLQGGKYDVETILRTEDSCRGLPKILVDPKEKERLESMLSTDPTSTLFKIKDDTFAATIIDQLDPETWKIKSKIEEKGNNLLHHFINLGNRFSALALLTTDHPHVTDLVFEKNHAGDTPLMSSLKKGMVGVSEKIWDLMLSRGQANIGEISSQLTCIVQLCAQYEDNQLLLKIIQTQNPHKICKLVFARSGEERTVLDTCRDEDTLIQILKLLEIRYVEADLLQCDKRRRNVLYHWARCDFYKAIDHLQNHLSAETFKNMIMERSSSGDNAMMVSASNGNKETLDILLRHVWLYLPTLYRNDVDEILHSEDIYGDTLLTLAFSQSENLRNANHLLLEMEKKYHASDTDQGKMELKECFRKYLRPSREVQIVLNNIKNSLPKSRIKTVAIWIKVFFTSLLLPLALFFFDMFFDAFLVYKYHGDNDTLYEDQHSVCRNHSRNYLSNRTLLLNVTFCDNVTLCEERILPMPFLCTPLALSNSSRFNYSLAFIISPWVFFFFEFYQSEEYGELSEKVNRSFLVCTNQSLTLCF